MREFIGATDTKQASLIPDIPALYWWVLDFDGPARSDEGWAEFFRRIGALEGPKQMASKISHLDIACQVSPEVVEPQFRDAFLSIGPESAETWEWARQVLTMLQRPLYVGITTNLTERVQDHIDAHRDGLQNKLGKSLEIKECAIAFVELPDDLIDEVYVEEVNDDGEPVRRLPDALRLVEYISLRTSMPMFNSIKRDS